MRLFDSHCHLQFPQYKDDLADVLARMQALQMGAVVVGTDLTTSKAGVELAVNNDFLWASVGLHPNDPSTGSTSSLQASSGQAKEEFDISNYEELAKNPKVVAIGECGLDYFRSGGTDEEKQVQKERFEKQIEFAHKLQKPLIIHCRDSKLRIANVKSAHDDTLEILFANLTKLANKVPIVMHFFTATAEIAQKYLDLGCYLSFPGPITFTDMYDESIRIAPLDKILAETDAPFAAPVPHRGKRNEPSYVAEVVKKIATIKNISPDEAASQVTLNSQRVFGLQ